MLIPAIQSDYKVRYLNCHRLPPTSPPVTIGKVVLQSNAPDPSKKLLIYAYHVMHGRERYKDIINTQIPNKYNVYQCGCLKRLIFYTNRLQFNMVIKTAENKCSPLADQHHDAAVDTQANKNCGPSHCD